MLIVWTVLYFSFFLDSLLMTAIVPILPNFLHPDAIGIVLSAKSIMKLISTPLVGYLAIQKSEFVLKTGTCLLLVVSILYAFNQNVLVLVFARALHGIASTCIIVAGFSTLAANPSYTSRIAYLLGASALGILVGHPFGSVFYEQLGQKTVFLILVFLILCLYLIQSMYLTFSDSGRQKSYQPISLRKALIFFLTNTSILSIFGAIFTSSLTTASLEPTLPEWLLERRIAISEWQLGIVFLPDTFGYFLSTNFAGLLFAFCISNKLRWVIAFVSLLVLGFNSVILGSLRTLSSILLPHFFIGFSIGLLDAALMPLLADLVSSHPQFSHFEIIFSLQEIVISLAYIIGNIVSVEIVAYFGFPFLVRFIGLLNVAYCPFLSILESSTSYL